MRLPGIVLLSALLCGGPVWAWPVDVYVDLEAGREQFQRLSAIAWVQVEDEKIATAEVLSSGELLLTGVTPGRTLVLLYGEGKVAVWRLRVGPKGEKVKPMVPDESDRAKLTRACPGTTLEEKLASTVAEDLCRDALSTFLETDAYGAGELEVVFELPALQAQLSDIQKGLKDAGLGKLELRYVGAGLILEGELSPEELRRALWIVFRRSVGRVPLEDRTTTAAP